MRVVLLAVAALATLGAVSPVTAQYAPPGCYSAPCKFTLQVRPGTSDYPSTLYDNDYTVQTDGRLHIYTIKFTSADPSASLSLTGVSQNDSFLKIRGQNGSIIQKNGSDNPGYDFEESGGPGLFRLKWMAPADYDFCSTRSGPEGQVCAARYNIFGNGSYLVLTSTADITGVFTANVPEPATWAMLTIGFGLVGATVRRRGRNIVVA